jgi:hypothetical protein
MFSSIVLVRAKEPTEWLFAEKKMAPKIEKKTRLFGTFLRNHRFSYFSLQIQTQHIKFSRQTNFSPFKKKTRKKVEKNRFLWILRKVL